MNKKEGQIIRLCQGGDLRQFAALYDAYAGKIYNFIYFKTLHRETAEDLTSQAFLKALEKIRTYDARKGSFSSWIYRIAANNVIDHYRAKKPEASMDDIWDLAAAGGDIETDIDVRGKLELARQSLERLKPLPRDILILRLWQELSYAEIAEIKGLTEANCRMAFFRAIRRLKEEMPAGALLLLFLFKNI